VLRKCSVCEREFAVGYDLNRHNTTVCPECRAIDEPRMKKETAQIADLIVCIENMQIADLIDRIENVWREYRNLQDQYRKLTGRDYEWLR